MKRLFFMSLAAAAGLYASAQSAVISEDFEGTVFPPAGWSVIDNDGDGSCWKSEQGSSNVTQLAGSSKLAISYTRDPASYSTLPAQDNWLVTPQIHVPNNACVLTFSYAAQDLDNTERIEVLVSTTGTAVDDFTPLRSATADNGYEDDIQWESMNIALAAYDGQDIYLAFRHVGSGSYGLSVDNIKVLNQNAPARPISFAITPGANGALSATLSWTNPSRTAAGGELGDFQVVILRDGAELAVISEGLVAAAEYSYTDSEVTNGRHTYSIAFRNAEGTTDFVSRSAYIGQDIPKAPRNTRSVVAGGSVTVLWEAVTAGVSSGYVDPEAITYTVLRNGEAVVDGLKETTFTDTPGAPGTYSYTVKAVNPAGESEVDYTATSVLFDASLFDATVYPSGAQDNYAPRIPVALNSRYSMSQTVFYPADLNGAQGQITDLVFKSFCGSSELTAAVKVYITPTDLTDLADKWVSLGDATPVFDGAVSMPVGTTDIAIHLDTPYDYAGGNFIVTVVGSLDRTGGYSDRFWCAATPGDKRSVSGDSYSAFEISNPPYGSVGEYVPMTRFILSANNLGAVAGTVNGSDGAEIANAKVAVAGHDYLNVVTDENGAYSIPFANVGTLSFTVSATGYTPVTEDVTVTAGQTATHNFTLPAIAKVKVAGTLATDDTRLPAAGAKVFVAGYDTAEATADENGHFEFTGIYAGESYTLTAVYPLYDAYTAEVSATADLDLGDITLARSVIAPWAVKSVPEADGSAAVITWESPMSRTGEPRELSLNGADVNDSFDGDYYSSDYNVGHFYSTETIAENNLTGLSVGAVKGFLKKPQLGGSIYACVWDGTRDNNITVARQLVDADALTADGSWVSTELPESVEFAEGHTYIVGFAFEGLAARDYVMGTAPYSGVYKRGVNNLRWDATGSVYDAYAAWNVVADFIIPGASGAVVDNPDVPQCEYNVWRRAVADDAEAEWTKVNGQPVSELSCSDASWAVLPSGTYQYAVSAIYHTGESAKAYGPLMQRSSDYDAAVTAFVSPVKSKEMVSSIDVVVTVTNLGEKPLSNIPVTVTIGEDKQLTATLAGPLNHGQSADLSLGSADIAEGVFTLVATAAAEGDQVESNNSISMTFPNMANITLTGYRWNAYGNAGVMSIESNAPEQAVFKKEITPSDALVTAGEYYDGTLYAFAATWYGAAKAFVAIDADNLVVVNTIPNEDVYVMDMAYNYATDAMWLLCAEGENQYLATVSLTDGAVTPVAQLQGSLHTLACSTAGQLYGVDSEGNLVTVDSASGALTVVGATGLAAPKYLQSMAFDHNTGRLFWAAESDLHSGYLHEIDPATGAASPLGNVLYTGIEPCEIVALHTPCSSTVGLRNVSSDLADGIEIFADGTDIIVRGAAGQTITVSDLDGRQLATVIAGAETRIHVGRPGLILVKAGPAAAKLLLR